LLARSQEPEEEPLVAALPAAPEPEEEPPEATRSEEEWWACKQRRWEEKDKHALGGARRHLLETLQLIRRARNEGRRVWVVLHLFSGRRRRGDYQEHVERLSAQIGLVVWVISIDMSSDAPWDLSDKGVQEELLSLGEDGCVDIVGGGPPCGSTSRARHRRVARGPRPLRGRAQEQFWNLGGLSGKEKARRDEANALWLFTMALIEVVSVRGGRHVWEHPEDLERYQTSAGMEWVPSLFNTAEMMELERRTGARRALGDQCTQGAPQSSPLAFRAPLRAWTTRSMRMRASTSCGATGVTAMRWPRGLTPRESRTRDVCRSTPLVSASGWRAAPCAR